MSSSQELECLSLVFTIESLNVTQNILIYTDSIDSIEKVLIKNLDSKNLENKNNDDQPEQEPSPIHHVHVNVPKTPVF